MTWRIRSPELSLGPCGSRWPRAAHSHTPLRGTVAVPPTRIEGSQTIFLYAEEITGEFLGEMKSIEQGIAALRSSLSPRERVG